MLFYNYSVELNEYVGPVFPIPEPESIINRTGAVPHYEQVQFVVLNICCSSVNDCCEMIYLYIS